MPVSVKELNCMKDIPISNILALIVMMLLAIFCAALEFGDLKLIICLSGIYFGFKLISDFLFARY